jgi:lipopolysaccharide export LptBFGC system permease protein LptF
LDSREAAEMKMDRYLARAVLTPTLLVLALLITLDSL